MFMSQCCSVMATVSLLQVDDHCDGFLDLPDDQDAGEHVLQLLSDDGLGGVPDGAVGCHHRLRG